MRVPVQRNFSLALPPAPNTFAMPGVDTLRIFLASKNATHATVSICT